MSPTSSHECNTVPYARRYGSCSWQDVTALRMTSSCHILTEPVVMMIAEVVSIVLLAEGRKSTYKRKIEDSSEVVKNGKIH